MRTYTQKSVCNGYKVTQQSARFPQITFKFKNMWDAINFQRKNGSAQNSGR